MFRSLYYRFCAILPHKEEVFGRIFLWGGAILVGLVSMMFAFLGDEASMLFQKVIKQYPYITFIMTPLGLGFCVMITKGFFPAISGSGIPQAIAAKKMKIPAEKVRVLSLRKAFLKILLTVIAIFCGASVGREGPTVQVGASIMIFVGRFFNYGKRSTLVIAGGAAGIAAAFNTPLAGIVFAVEELSRAYVQKTTSLIVTTVIIAGATSLALKGNYTYFGKMSLALGEPVALITMLICAIICGILGGAFAKIVLLLSPRKNNKVACFRKKHSVLFAFICGFIIALIGLLSAQTSYGTGYLEAKTLLQGEGDLPMFYGVYKLLSLLFSYISGIPGGIFAPCLAVGAGIGHDIARFFNDVSSQAIVLLGMVAFLSAVVQSPITAFVIVMEMTDDHEILLPLMAVSLVSTGVSKMICSKSLYHELALDYKSVIKPDKSVFDFKKNTINTLTALKRGFKGCRKNKSTQAEDKKDK